MRDTFVYVLWKKLQNSSIVYVCQFDFKLCVHTRYYTVPYSAGKWVATAGDKSFDAALAILV